MGDFLTELFGDNLATQDEVAAGLAVAKVAEAARLAALETEQEAARLRQITHRCPRWLGSGKLPQFTYRAGGRLF